MTATPPYKLYLPLFLRDDFFLMLISRESHCPEAQGDPWFRHQRSPAGLVLFRYYGRRKEDNSSSSEFGASDGEDASAANSADGSSTLAQTTGGHSNSSHTSANSSNKYVHYFNKITYYSFRIISKLLKWSVAFVYWKNGITSVCCRNSRSGFGNSRAPTKVSKKLYCTLHLKLSIANPIFLTLLFKNHRHTSPKFGWALYLCKSGENRD